MALPPPGWLLTTLLLACAPAAANAAQAPCVEVAPELRERPDPDGTPTRVTMGVYLIDLYAVDDVEQTFGADLILTTRWTDARLDFGQVGDWGDSCAYAPSEVWNPEPMLLNARSVDLEGDGLVRVRAGGECSLIQRYKGTFSFRGDLRDFPLDRQVLPVRVVLPPRVGAVELAADEELSGIWEDASIPNWLLRDMSARTFERYLPQVRAQVHTLEFALEVERHHAYYVWKLIVPLIIVVMMSWAVFWISPKSGVQLGLGATSVLTLIAYRFATATLLPPIGYLTRLDLFLTGSSVLVLLALVEALVTAGLGDKDRVEAALRIDRACRVAVPVLFAGIIVWSFWL